MRSPLVFDIKRHALEDGPGIRSTVFFKGCNLRCVWCHNPESLDPLPEVAFKPASCIGCGECVKACPNSCCSLSLPGRIARKTCGRCGECVKACPGKALRVVGRYYPIAELVEVLLRDRVYYETSRGGVTFSGGEPTLFMDYLSAALRELKKAGIHTALQTNGNFFWPDFAARLLNFIDLILFDLKLVDKKAAIKYTGSRSQHILKNFLRLQRQDKVRVIPRVPLVPGFTATAQNLADLKRLLGACNAKCVLLPYNPLGLDKWALIGRPRPPFLSPRMTAPDQERHWREIMKEVLL